MAVAHTQGGPAGRNGTGTPGDPATAPQTATATRRDATVESAISPLTTATNPPDTVAEARPTTRGHTRAPQRNANPRPNGRAFAGPTLAEMRRQEAQGIVERLCLWGEPGATSVFWARLKGAVRPEHLRESIRKVERVQQRDGRTRFDLFVAKPVTHEIQHLIATRPHTTVPVVLSITQTLCG